MITDRNEGLNVPLCRLSEFMDDLEGRLSLLTGLVDYEEFGLTLEDVRKPLLVVGLPGIGKTCGVMSIRKKLNTLLPEGKKLGFKKILLGQTVVGSMTGIPVVMPDKTVVRVQIPDLPDPQRDGEYGILFLDEITTANEAQVQPALGLCDDSRNIGEYTLPEHWIVVAAGNGPESTNFERLDDMTISRFVTYNILYEYQTDWRPWAHENDVNSDIIAFLNFDKDMMVRVESNDMHKAGKLFPCPRTWTRLSIELKMREALGRPVSGNTELKNFAGRIVGESAGRMFAAFCDFKTRTSYDVGRIVDGTEVDPEPMEGQVFHLLLEGCIKKCETLCTSLMDEDGNHPREAYQAVANVVNWFLKFETFDYDNCMNAFGEIRHETTQMKSIFASADFRQFCPDLLKFLERNKSFLISNFALISR